MFLRWKINRICGRLGLKIWSIPICLHNFLGKLWKLHKKYPSISSISWTYHLSICPTFFGSCIFCSGAAKAAIRRTVLHESGLLIQRNDQLLLGMWIYEYMFQNWRPSAFVSCPFWTHTHTVKHDLCSPVRYTIGSKHVTIGFFPCLKCDLISQVTMMAKGKESKAATQTNLWHASYISCLHTPSHTYIYIISYYLYIYIYTISKCM